MSLRNQFNAERDARVSRRLADLARNFERDLRKRVGKDPRSMTVDFAIEEIKNSEFRTTEGYKNLHAAAHAADVKLVVSDYSDRVTVTINKPYAESPDARLFFPPAAQPAKPAPATPQSPAPRGEDAPTSLDIVREKAKDLPKPKAGPGAPAP